MAAPQWLTERWEPLFEKLAQASTEAEVEAICQAEIEAWKAQPSIKKESSLRNHMMLTHEEIETRLSGDQRAWAEKHLAFSRGWYIKHNAPSQAHLSERLEHQQLLRDPDAIAAKGDALLDSDNWPDIVVGLFITTGRRPIEMYVLGSFEFKTEYSVVFSGQAKRRGDPLPPYEIPTLCKAQRAIDALARVRESLDTTNMDLATVTRKYSPLVKEAANRHFADLVPVRHSERTRKTDPEREEGLYGQLFRAVYPRLCVYWYCPPTVDDRHFMATIQGHRKRFEEMETEEERISYSSGAHYSDYKIADAQGNIDGRQGLKLGAEGIELLEVFKPKSRRKTMTVTQEQETEEKETQGAAGRNVPISVDRRTFNQEMALKTRLAHRTHTETVKFLLTFYEEHEGRVGQVQMTPESLAGEEKVKLEEEEVLLSQLIQQALAVSEDKRFRSFLIDALTKEAKFRLSLSKRHADKDFSQVPTSQLAKIKHPEAAKEKIRRAIIAIVKHNESVQSANDRWYINPTAVQKVAGSRFPAVNAYFAEHQAEIDLENEEYSLNARYNHKPISIDEVISIPEEPPSAQKPIAEMLLAASEATSEAGTSS